MFAILKTGGKQYRVRENDVIRIEKLDQEVGAKVVLEDILMVNTGKDVKVGDATKGATVEGEVIDQLRDKKVIIFKKKRRHNYRRKKGHRQHKTLLKISKISA